jgi:hypothetical protein
MSMRQIVAARVCSACCKNTTQHVVVRQNAAARDVVARGSSALLYVVVRQNVAGSRACAPL